MPNPYPVTLKPVYDPPSAALEALMHLSPKYPNPHRLTEPADPEHPVRTLKGLLPLPQHDGLKLDQ